VQVAESTTAVPDGAAAVRYELAAVRYATLRSSKRELYYRYDSYGEPDGPVDMDYFFWVLRDGQRTVLIDTGFDPGVGSRRGRTCLVAPLAALARLGIERQTVSHVVVTHLHYDHIGNLAQFPDAELIVPARELEFWASPMAAKFQFASHVEPAEITELQRAQREGRVRLTDGEQEILPGVKAIRVGGHSPGQLVTIVSGRSGDVVLTSDAVHFYAELERERPFGVLADLGEMYAAYALIKQLAARPGAVVVAGHDPDVMRRFGPWDEGSEELAVRVVAR
jgi:glyoxylase-like metal-dependent hydrolase (beta-lactamase superfamily II)